MKFIKYVCYSSLTYWNVLNLNVCQLETYWKSIVKWLLLWKWSKVCLNCCQIHTGRMYDLFGDFSQMFFNYIVIKLVKPFLRWCLFIEKKTEIQGKPKKVSGSLYDFTCFIVLICRITSYETLITSEHHVNLKLIQFQSSTQYYVKLSLAKICWQKINKHRPRIWVFWRNVNISVNDSLKEKNEDSRL